MEQLLRLAELFGHNEITSKLHDLIETTAIQNSNITNDITDDLFYAIETNNSELVISSLNHGANVNQLASNGWSTLNAAALGADTEIINLLLNAGANLELRDNYGWTALFCNLAKSTTNCKTIIVTWC